MSKECLEFVDALHPNPALRLGVVSASTGALHEDPFLVPIDFESLLRGDVVYAGRERIKSKGKELFSGQEPEFKSFEELDASSRTISSRLAEFGDGPTISGKMLKRYDRYFSTWDYISKMALREEFSCQRAIIDEGNRRMNLGWDATFLPEFDDAI